MTGKLPKVSIDFVDSSTNWIISIVNIVNWIISNLVFSVAVIRMTWLTKCALNESENMANVTEHKKKVHLRLLIFSMFPLLLNLLFLVPEIWTVIISFSRFEKGANQTPENDDLCEWENTLNRDGLPKVVELVTVTFSMFLYYVGYIVLYPNIRKAFV